MWDAEDLSAHHRRSGGSGTSVVGYHPIMPGVGKMAQAVTATGGLEDSLHVPVMTILSCRCKMMPRVHWVATSDGALNMARRTVPFAGVRLILKTEKFWA